MLKWPYLWKYFTHPQIWLFVSHWFLSLRATISDLQKSRCPYDGNKQLKLFLFHCCYLELPGYDIPVLPHRRVDFLDILNSSTEALVLLVFDIETRDSNLVFIFLVWQNCFEVFQWPDIELWLSLWKWSLVQNLAVSFICGSWINCGLLKP